MWILRGRMLLNPDANAAGGGGGSSGSGAAGGTQTAGGAGVSSGGSSGGGFQAPAGQRLVSESDWAARDAFYGAGSKHFKDPADFDKFGPLIGAARDGGHDLGLLTNLLGRKPEQKAADGTPKQLTEADIDRMLGEKMTAQKREEAEKRHREHFEKLPTMRDGLVKSLLGEKPDAVLAKIVPALVNDAFQTARAKNAYPEGHPLAGIAGELSDKDIEAVTTDIKGILDGLRGMQMKAIGAAGNRTPSAGSTPGVGGNAGGNGRADNTGAPKKMSKDDIRELVSAESARLAAGRA